MNLYDIEKASRKLVAKIENREHHIEKIQEELVLLEKELVTLQTMASEVRHEMRTR